MGVALCARCESPIPSAKRSDARFCSVRCGNAVKARRHRQRHPKRTNHAWQRYAHSEKGRVTLLLNYAQDRARRHSLPFDLDREWLEPKLAMGKCELTGLTLSGEVPGQYRIHPFAPSLDRIHPDAGYVKTNTRLVCFAVNMARSDWGDAVLMQIAEALVKGVTE